MFALFLNGTQVLTAYPDTFGVVTCRLASGKYLASVRYERDVLPTDFEVFQSGVEATVRAPTRP